MGTQTPERLVAPADSQHEGTRERLLHAIMQQGPIGATELAHQFDLTVSGIRRHLQALVDDGLISEREQPALLGQRRRGRPSRHYVALHEGDKAEITQPRDYEGLALQALDHLRRLGGDDAVRAFAADRWSQIETILNARISPDAPVREKVEKLAEILAELGYAASARPGPTVARPGASVGHPARPTAPASVHIASLQLCQGNCPVQHAAKQYPELCEAETQGLAKMLGVPVQRLATLAQGGHSCTTNIPLLEGTPQ
ncbi:winged helix-turn-helix transcriptional regulator [Micrococcales bacterium 31B]|nr:winged helix-turn-helix transcriptional regulator [Micrococcales bacterium 31B]